jgi:DNA-binding LytR/AlgR family response regulator
MIKIKYPQSNEILFLKGDINYTEFHLVDGKKMLSSLTLLRHQEKFERFIRVSKNHLVNPDFVKDLECHGYYATISLKDGREFIVSRRRLRTVKGRFDEAKNT